MMNAVIPAEANDAARILLSTFGEDLVAVYLYGSAVAGSLQRNSDVDILAVVRGLTAPAHRRSLGREFLSVSGHYPPIAGQRRPLEVSIFARDAIANFRHPITGEFVYGEWLRHAYETGDDVGPSTNPDFTLLLAQVRQQGVSLHGPAAALLLPLVGAEDVQRAILEALPDLMGSLIGDERNVILTLARMWFTLSTGQFTTKDAAADWVMERMPPDMAPTLQLARDGYLGNVSDNWHTKDGEADRVAQYLAEVVRMSGDPGGDEA